LRVQQRRGRARWLRRVGERGQQGGLADAAGTVHVQDREGWLGRTTAVVLPDDPRTQGIVQPGALDRQRG